MTRSGRYFTDEFKRKAVRLAEQSDSNISRVARTLGWIQAFYDVGLVKCAMVHGSRQQANRLSPAIKCTQPQMRVSM
jgi:transposase-like protein